MKTIDERANKLRMFHKQAAAGPEDIPATIDELKRLYPQGGASGAVDVSLNELKQLYQQGGASGAADVSLNELKQLYPQGGASGTTDVSLNELKQLYPQGGASGSTKPRGGSSYASGDTDASTDGVVSEIQKILTEHGYALPEHGVDGKFGSETKIAVMNFQEANSSNGLTPTGVVNAKTMSVLRSPIAVKKKVQSPEDAAAAVAAGAGAAAAAAVGGIGVSPAAAASAGGSITRVAAGKLYADLKAGIANENLCKAMVANAIAESGLRVNVNGDCGSYASSRSDRAIDTSLYPNIFHKPKRGQCCSFGLWQYNICGGLGNSLLEAYGAGKNSSDADKIAILTSYQKNVDFMIGHVNKRAKISLNKSVDWWVDWFVRKVERPANMDKAVVKRQQIARGLNLA